MVLDSDFDSHFDVVLGASGANSTSSFEWQCGQFSGGNAEAKRLIWN